VATVARLRQETDSASLLPPLSLNRLKDPSNHLSPSVLVAGDGDFGRIPKDCSLVILFSWLS
jgi:hypothetical protein